MRFQRGVHYPHPARGRARKPYALSDAAWRQRVRNLRRTRIRSDRESLIIQHLIWQTVFESGHRSSQRTLARQLHVWPSYVCKVQKQKARGLEALASGRRFTRADLEEARRFTERTREEGLLVLSRRSYGNEPHYITPDEIIAEQRREAEEWKRENLWLSDTRRRIRVPIPR